MKNPPEVKMSAEVAAEVFPLLGLERMQRTSEERWAEFLDYLADQLLRGGRRYGTPEAEAAEQGRPPLDAAPDVP